MSWFDEPRPVMNPSRWRHADAGRAPVEVLDDGVILAPAGTDLAAVREEWSVHYPRLRDGFRPKPGGRKSR